MQVYAVVYDNNGNFLIAKKNKKGYFFGDGKKGTIYKNGTSITNGPGKFAFPGGKKGKMESDVDAAKREFKEETGYEITSIGKLIDEYHYKKEYYAAFFELSNDDLKKVSSEIGKNLCLARKAAEKIPEGAIEKYKDIYKKYPNCPADNELASVEIWNIKNDWEKKIKPLKNGSDLDWYYDILEYFGSYFLNSTQV